MTKYRLRVVKGVIKIKKKDPLDIFDHKLSDQSHSLPKNKVLSYVEPNDLTMVTISDRIYNKVARSLCIPGVNTTEQTEHEVMESQEISDKEEPKPLETSKDDIDLPTILDPHLRTRVRDMLEKNKFMWAGKSVIFLLPNTELSSNHTQTMQVA